MAESKPNSVTGKNGETSFTITLTGKVWFDGRPCFRIRYEREGTPTYTTPVGHDLSGAIRSGNAKGCNVEAAARSLGIR